MKEPLVSVVIPFYANAQWLEEALSSVMNQTYHEIEVIVINDGSEENIDFIRKKYRDKIYIYDKENGGPASARNLGIRVSKGKYIAFLDSDDLWFPDKLKKQINFMEKKQSVWSQHSYSMLMENGKTKTVNTDIYSGDVYRDCFISFKIQTSCVVVLRKVLINNLIFFPEHKRYGQDGAFYRILAEKYNLHSFGEVLSYFRIRNDNAGFQAKIQLNSRASTWNEIKNNNYILNQLPLSLMYSYRLAFINSKVIDCIEKFIKNKNIIEYFSKALYLSSYLFFKKHSKK